MEPVWLISSILLWLIVLFNLTLTLALVQRYRAPAAKRAQLLPKGAPAPSFTAETPAGKTVTLVDVPADHEIALVFVSPHCGPCLEKVPFFNNLYHPAQRAKVDLILVSDSDREATGRFVAAHNVTVPVLAAPRTSNPLWEAYRVTGTPTYYLLDRLRQVKTAGLLDGEWHELTARWIAA